MASLKSFSTEPEPERFQRTQHRNTSSERAASPSVASSVDGDEPGGARLDFESATGSPEYASQPTPARQAVSSTRYRNTHQVVPRTSTDLSDVFTCSEDGTEIRGLGGVIVSSIERVENGVHTFELRTRSSNLSGRHQINGVDAQAVLPSDACVFVANLPEPKDDISLEAGLMREFSKYGKCYVKIRRDTRHMPFAFIQYIDEADARKALEQARGAIICGRACRTEMVKANKTFIIMRKHGGAITPAEARGVLSAFGDFSRVETMHPSLRESFGYPATVLVEFVKFDPDRDLFTAFRNDDTYSVAAFDMSKNCVSTRQTNDEVYLANCERDRRSIYIGELPASTDEHELAAMFATAGDIIKINLVNRPQGNGNGFASGVKTLAFIEYSQSDMPELAIARFNGTVFKGNTIKVERKAVKDRGPTPRNSRHFSARRIGNTDTSTASPTHHGPGSAARLQGYARTQQPQHATIQYPMTSPHQTGPGQAEGALVTPVRPTGTRALTINTQQTPRVPISPAPGGMAGPISSPMGFPLGYPYGAYPSPFMPPNHNYYGTPGASGVEPVSPWSYYQAYWQPPPPPPPGAHMDPMAMYNNAYMIPGMMDPATGAFVRAIAAPAQVAIAGPSSTGPVTGAAPDAAAGATSSPAAAGEQATDGDATPTRAKSPEDVKAKAGASKEESAASRKG